MTIFGLTRDWKQFRNSPYLISEQGEVGCLGTFKGPYARYWGLVTTHLNTYGYPAFLAYIPPIQYSRRWLVHRCVAELFIGPQPIDKPLVLHKDGIKIHNWVDNLYYGTAKENREDMERHGTVCYGSKNPATKITKEIALDVKRRILKNERNQDIADAHGIPKSIVSNIRYLGAWAYLDKELEREKAL